MTARSLQFSSSAQKFIVDLHPPLQTRIENALLEIATNPRVGKPLKGDLKGGRLKLREAAVQGPAEYAFSPGVRMGVRSAVCVGKAQRVSEHRG